MRTVIATGNAHKVSEMRAILGDMSDSVVSMKEAGIDCEIVEDGKTFMENSLIKARAVKKYWDGTVIADDSGIVIDALGGAPGVESARFMGEDTPYTVKNQAILDKMKGVEGKGRSARFVCAMVAILPDGREICVEETMEGEIAESIEGENGFGYDPIFYLPEFGCTSAQLSPEGKNDISHRGKALRELQRRLKEEHEPSDSVKDIVKKMKENAPYLSAQSHENRLKALRYIREALIKGKDKVFSANEKDIKNAEEEGISPSVIKRLKFDESKLNSVISGIDTLLGLEDPIGKVSLKRSLSDGLLLERHSVPIGVIGVIFEARPDALVQISCLCIKSGNMCILKGGKETEMTNAALFELIYDAARNVGLPDYCLVRVSKHNEIAELLTCEKDVDLIIPRGSNAFVKYIMDNTSIPVLGHADGICHTYVDENYDMDLALKVCLDAKIQYPAACNATETLLVNKNVAKEFLPKMNQVFKDNKVKMYGTKEACKFIEADEIDPLDFKREYLDYAISVKLVGDVKEAVEHINKYGSHHTDCIVTEDDSAWDYFSTMVDSAGVYRNISTRFADGFRYGFGAEVGISTSKIHARGPVGLEGLMTYKYLLVGSGHCVGDFESGERNYLFKDFT